LVYHYINESYKGRRLLKKFVVGDMGEVYGLGEKRFWIDEVRMRGSLDKKG
jgi:hypothetical protein